MSVGFVIRLRYFVGFVRCNVLWLVEVWLWIEVIFCFNVLMWLVICSVKLLVIVVGLMFFVFFMNNFLLIIFFMVCMWEVIVGWDIWRWVVVCVMLLFW